VRTARRPELRAPAEALGRLLRGGATRVPLAQLAALFGATGEALDRARARGDLVLDGGRFSNSGPAFTAPAGSVEIEIPDLLRGRWAADERGWSLAFDGPDFCPRACAQIAFFRKCFDLRQIRATQGDLTLDFGSDLADRRFEF
jgi:hypothetical protein